MKKYSTCGSAALNDIEQPWPDPCFQFMTDEFDMVPWESCLSWQDTSPLPAHRKPQPNGQPMVPTGEERPIRKLWKTKKTITEDSQTETFVAAKSEPRHPGILELFFQNSPNTHHCRGCLLKMVYGAHEGRPLARMALSALGFLLYGFLCKMMAGSHL